MYGCESRLHINSSEQPMCKYLCYVYQLLILFNLCSTFVLVQSSIRYTYLRRQAPTAGLNWAIFSAVCMASRLPEAGHVMVLVLVATVLFAAWPPICRAVKDADKRWDLLMTATMVCTTTHDSLYACDESVSALQLESCWQQSKGGVKNSSHWGFFTLGYFECMCEKRESERVRESE